MPDELAAYAYDDGPLPIGAGQTIAQPYIVALMIDAAGVSFGAFAMELRGSLRTILARFASSR